MKESEEGQEQLYICDHASEKCGKCAHREKHTIAHSCNYSCNEDWGGQVECIPYKEEPKKACLTCGVPGVCTRSVPSDMSCWIPPKEAPKTKRVGVIWFGEVPVDKCENPIISDEMTGYVYDQVELIDPDRLRYGVPEKGDVICDVRGTKLRSTTLAYEPGAFRLIIDPPTPEPEPETVEDVLKRMPKTEDYTSESQDKYWCDMVEFEKDYKAALKREDNK